MRSDVWVEYLLRSLTGKAEYWKGDILEDGSGNRWKIVDLAYSPFSGTFKYKIEKVDRKPPFEDEGWNSTSEMALTVVQEADRPEPLSYDFDVDEIDEIDEKFQAIEDAVIEKGEQEPDD